MQAHVNCHKERCDVFFKCFFCPFYVSTKEEVIQHMTVHQQAPKGDSNNTDTSVTPSSLSACTSQAGIQGGEVQVKKEILPTDQDINTAVNEEVRPSDLSIPPPALDFTHLTEASVCWVLREDKLQKMLRCRYCPHVNLRRANMIEHEKMHLKRSSVTSSEAPVGQSHHAPYFCPDCSYVCNNAGVLSTHTKVHVPSYPQAYSFYDPYRSESMQIKEIIERYQLKLKVEETSPKSSSSKETVETGNENKLSGINVMSLLDPNQSLTDAVLAMKKKFNLELDGEPFAEPVDDSAESLSCSPLKQMNEGVDPSAMDTPNDKQLHFCHLCPARFLSRQELGIHSRFHNLYLIHKCDHCSYTARQRSHLQAHFKVHSEDYQDRTNALLKMYKVHKEFDMPRIVCANLKVGAIGNPWIVVTSSGPPEPPPAPKFACRKCPAAFFKNDALQAHLALHGSSNPHKCRICDYAVKTYGNLIKHMVSHGCKTSVAKKILQGRMEVPESLRSANTFNEFTPEPEMGDEENQSADTTINQYEEESAENFPCTEMDSNVKADACMETDRQLAVDENIGMRENDNSSSESLSPPKNSEFASGSPDFVYPTYCRNGRVKVKRYKCLKCPSAFEKKDQYLIHMGLHGSKQRYKCTKCDYSVKFFANHIQHLKRHQISEEAKGGSKDDSESSTNEGEESLPDDTENIPASLPSSPSRSAKTTGGKGEKLSVADKQAIMVLQQRRAKRSAISRESLDKNYWCSHCPYSSPRKDLVESHMRRHYLVSGVKNAFVCSHCDYSVPNKHFLRDHTKLHFDVSKAPKPDAFMICDGLELYASSGFLGKGKSKGKVLIFQDKGSNVASDRFLPPLASDGTEDSNDSASKIFINPTTLESENFGENGNKDIADASGDAENSTEHEKEPDIKHSEISSGGSGRDVTKGMGEPIIAKDSSEIIVVQANNSCSPTVVED